VPLVLALIATSVVTLAAGCDSTDDQDGDGASSTTTVAKQESGDIEGQVGVALKVANVVVTVRGLQTTFQPAMPVQRLSDETPSAPDAGESFYQAYVRVENKGVSPIRVDADDFACVIGETVARIEPTRSGPAPRSLLKNTSIDLLLTFKGPDGYEPILLYAPPWHDGVMRVDAGAEVTTSTSS